MSHLLIEEYRQEIIINLKVLSKVEQNKKIITRESYLNIESGTYVPEFLKRWYRGDNREETIRKVALIITRAIELYNSTSKEKKVEMKRYIDDARKGIVNLRETYSNCPQTIARLDTVLDTIDTLKEE